MADTTQEKLLRVKEVADRLGLSTNYIYILIRRGKLNTVKVGARAVRIPESILAAYLKAQER